MLTKRAAAFPSGALFLAVLLLNVYLLFNLVKGAQIVQQVEVTQGRSLSCYELYQARALDAYFYPAQSVAGDVIYGLSFTWPLWLALSGGVALLCMIFLRQKARWRWLPIGLMGGLLVLLVLYLPVAMKIACAIE